MAEDAEDRSETATARHLQQAREQGNVPLSRDTAGLASLGVGLAILIFTAPYEAARLAEGLSGFFAAISDPDLPVKLSLLRAVTLLMQTVAPLVLGVMVAGLCATWLQTGFLFHLGAIKFDLTRLSPGHGWARIFSTDHLVEMLKSVLKIGALGFAAVRTLMAEAPALQDALEWTPRRFMEQLLVDTARIVLAMVLAQAVIVAADLLWVRLKHQRDMRMSREDIKQERKDMDGDPHIKAKRKRIRFIRARRRMMAAVPKATVVITNPTHYAIALEYTKGSQAAPRVVAKGVDEVAANIREVAALHHVPLVANPPLARALYLVEVDAEIPAEHFQAVAEIIAYVWRLKTAFKASV
jgi:flagellar biosynthetic protein FlhB